MVIIKNHWTPRSLDLPTGDARPGGLADFNHDTQQS